MQVWFTEDQTPNLRISVRVRQVLHQERSAYQEVMVLDTVEFGRMLVLDDVIQTSQKDEFAYHEMMAHVPLFAHPDPRRVLVIGGGDGGVLREVLRHPTVEEAHMAEIDPQVVEAARRFLPELNDFDNPRARVFFTDGIRHVEEHPEAYDVIIVDSTDPVGPAVALFGTEFHRAVFRALRPGGIFVQQSESPFFNRDLIRRVQASLRSVFPVAGLYWGVVPTYPGGFWTYSVATRGTDPRRPREGAWEAAGLRTRYYTPDVHRAAFALPPFVAELLEPAPAVEPAPGGGAGSPEAGAGNGTPPGAGTAQVAL
ncbi:spermidine synthase [Thermaerobacter marianensis DSM 12885]|uniref:Polyamine aminopropyltransferase n=1 Tax=Thermaerobacter marianensis (strain ATCC 700841 / DSM 12885 / JCM 10246 / 7p75a) TaxID=644966 RepID=E6SLH6_THEM7|nr:polyamine aminopropyltransferase [Thermaerobacter marianensis]ADU52418.1 spermidine synthase [Thermaerobacter marianensis DSM 12885]